MKKLSPPFFPLSLVLLMRLHSYLAWERASASETWLLGSSVDQPGRFSQHLTCIWASVSSLPKSTWWCRDGFLSGIQGAHMCASTWWRCRALPLDSCRGLISVSPENAWSTNILNRLQTEGSWSNGVFPFPLSKLLSPSPALYLSLRLGIAPLDLSLGNRTCFACSWIWCWRSTGL